MEECFLYNLDKDKENKWLPAVDLAIVNLTDKVDTEPLKKPTPCHNAKAIAHAKFSVWVEK